MTKRTASELWDALDEATAEAELESSLAKSPEERRLTILPFVILWGLIELLPPWEETHSLDLSPVATAHGDD